MRHRVKKDKLSRYAEHRKSLLRNLATQVFENGKIKTTRAKAKAIQPVIEKIITYLKTHSQLDGIKYLNSYIYTESASKKAISTVKEKCSDRDSGYTRITNIKYRVGDNAQVVLFELI